MEKISLKQYAERTGLSYGYLLKKLFLQREAKKEPKLTGVSHFERFGNSWLLSIDGRSMPAKKNKLKKDE